MNTQTQKNEMTNIMKTKCAICWEDIGEKNNSIMNCGHTFHFSCITSNILKGSGDHSMNCPLCRELIVNEEFADCCVEIIPDDDTDSMPELEEADDETGQFNRATYWSGSQLWRRDLSVRDRVKMEVEMDTTGEMLNRMGWDLNDDDIITTRYDEYEDSRAFIFCSVVCVIDDPLPGMAPFLLKPIDGRNRLQLQAYQPKQIEVHTIELLSGDWRDEEIEARAYEEELIDEDMHNAMVHFNNSELISKRQIHDKPVHEIMETIDEKIEKLGLLSICTYKKRTVCSMIHKITMDILMEHKNKQAEDIISLNYI